MAAFKNRKATGGQQHAVKYRQSHQGLQCPDGSRSQSLYNLSWEHCYTHFQQHAQFRTEADYQHASLHLAFFLASWGMYRGSSFLSKKDYLIHIPVVRVICEPRYEQLWDPEIGSGTARGAEGHVKLLIEIGDRIREVYGKIMSVDGKTRDVVATDTLLTKIILGTMGCCVAYDRYAVLALGSLGIRPARFSRDGYCSLLRFCQDHAEELTSVEIRTKQGNRKYPVMKLADMYLSEVGASSQASSQ